MELRLGRLGGAATCALAISVSATAHETDQFTVPVGWQFADIGDELTALYYDTIEEGVVKLNDDIRRGRETGRSEAYVAQFYTPDAVADSVYDEFKAAFFAIENLEWQVHRDSRMKKRYPGRVTGHWESMRNVYLNVYFPLDPRQFWRLWHASTMNVYGTYFGPDKIGHFNDMGYVYYLIYRGAIRKGLSEEEALEKMLAEGMNGLLLGERGFLGYITAGSYSNADLAANYAGFKFYMNLTAETRLKGKLQPPMVQRDGEFWRVGPHVRRDSEFFAQFISDHFNEALNSSVWDASMCKAMRRSVRTRSEQVREFYADDNGNRRPQAYFDARIEELSTYYGEDYGHFHKPARLVSIGNTCFESLPPDAPPDARNEAGETPLHQAAANGDTVRVIELLDSGAEIDASIASLEERSAEWGGTPLHAAAAAGQPETVRLLLDRGAAVNRADSRGVTPLHKGTGHAAVVEILLAAGADVHARDERGRTPLHWLARYPNLESVRALVNAGAYVDATDHTGETPLHRAAMWGRLEMIEALIDLGACVHARADFGTTPLHFAVRQDDPAVVERLVRAGVDVNATDEFGLTPLHDVARHGSRRIAETLLAAGADLNAADGFGSTPLHVAVRHDRPSAVSLLLAAGADIDAASASGSRPIHEAAFVGRTKLVGLLLENGANVHVANARGQTPVELARAHGNTLAALMLSSSMAQTEALARRPSTGPGTGDPLDLP
ncbi:MAG: ankyrin repeat domain-containing protein [Planctomycetota bacterium]|jgi:ankyrin repeat protein